MLESKNSDFMLTSEYFNRNKLSLNVGKCECMLVGTQQALEKFKDVNIRIGNQKVKKVQSTKYLGIHIDENLRWTNHVDCMVKKISSKIGILRKLKRTVPNDCLQTLYNTIVLPHFDYGDVIYDSCTATDKHRLQNLQNRAARILTGSGPRTHRRDMFKSLGWLTLENRLCK